MPVIDDDLADSVWQHAESATNLYRAKEGITHPAELNTEVRVIYDEDVLYIAARCEEPDMKNLRETIGCSYSPYNPISVSTISDSGLIVMT